MIDYVIFYHACCLCMYKRLLINHLHGKAAELWLANS